MDSDTYFPLKQAVKFSAVIFLLYLCTLAPDLVWQDQGDYQYQAARLTLNIPGDAVRVHPLYIIVSHIAGKFTPLSWAYASNLVSAVCGAITTFNIFLIIAMLGRAVFPAFLGAGVYSLAHTPWFIAVQAQTYTMSMALMTGGLLVAILYYKTLNRKYLISMGLIFGLGVSTHLMSQIAFAVIMVWLFFRLCCGKLKVIDFLAICISWAIGGIFLWIVMAIEYRQTGDVYGTICSALWGRWGNQVFNMERFAYLVRQSIKFFVLNFPTPLVLFSIAGIAYSVKNMDKLLSRILAAITVLSLIFAIRYDVPNQNHFFLPMYAMICVYIGLGYQHLAQSNRRVAIISAAMLLLIPAMYPAMAYLAKAKNIPLGTRRHIPYRDIYSYYLMPWQQDQTGPRRLVEETLKALPENAVLYVDSTPMSAFEYAMFVEGKRPDVTLPERLGDRAIVAKNVRIFTICDTDNYRPSWTTPEQLKPFPISETEHIFEIIKE